MSTTAGVMGCGAHWGRTTMIENNVLQKLGDWDVSARVERSTPGSLDGIYKKFGMSLPLVERVRGSLEICEVTANVLNGFLTTGEQRIRVRFEDNARGPLPVLRREVNEARIFDADALSVARWPIWISARPWVEDEGNIVLLVRSFGWTSESRGAL